MNELSANSIDENDKMKKCLTIDLKRYNLTDVAKTSS